MSPGINSISIPISITSIGDYTFYGCTGLKSVIIPPSVSQIGTSAFAGCSGLIKSAYPYNISIPFSKGISVAYNPDNATVEDGFIFKNDNTEIIFASYNLEGKYEIPNYVTKIGESAFYGCSGITSLSIGNSVTEIGE